MRRTILTLSLCCLLVLPAARADGPAKATAPAKGPAPAKEPVAPKNDPHGPRVSLDVNNSAEAVSYQGWPILITAGVAHPLAYAAEEKLEPILLAAREGPWTNALRLEVRNAKDEVLKWPLHLATTATPTLELNAETSGVAGWWLSPEETGAIPEGTYLIRAFLDSTMAQDPKAWKGVQRSARVRITIAKQAAELNAEQEEEKYLLLSQYASLRDDNEGAMTYLTTLLAHQPKSMAGLSSKGDLLVEAGKPRDALDAYSDAINVYYEKNPNPQEPPQVLLRKHRNVLRSLMKAPPQK